MSLIESLHAREILDSRGNPTVEVDAWLDDGAFGRAGVPSGASTGEHEALELRDGDERFGGKGVLDGGRRRQRPDQPTRSSDSTRSTSAGWTTRCSRSTARRRRRRWAPTRCWASRSRSRAPPPTSAGQPLWRWVGGPNAHVLPTPMMNVINGGAHADNELELQEFMVMPVGAASFSEGLRWGAEVFHALKALLHEKGLATGVGDEGGFAPEIATASEALEWLLRAIEKAGLTPGDDVALAMDPASPSSTNDGRYRLEGADPERRGHDRVLVRPARPVPDRLARRSRSARTTGRAGPPSPCALGSRVQLVGDDLFVTNSERLERGLREGAANSILIKVNQIGTLTETLDTIDLARRNAYATVISHRSGETEDTTIADLAVATNAGQIKTGAPSRGERTAKYNQLLRIEEELGEQARYAGVSYMAGAG